MRLSPLFRLAGAILYGFIGWELGIALAGTTELTSESWQIIVPSPWLGQLLDLPWPRGSLLPRPCSAECTTPDADQRSGCRHRRSVRRSLCLLRC